MMRIAGLILTSQWFPLSLFLIGIGALYCIQFGVPDWFARDSGKSPPIPDAYITAQLETFSPDMGYIPFSLHVQNGPVQIENLRVAYKTDDFGSFDTSAYLASMLPPNAKLNKAGPPLVLAPGKVTNLTARIYYDADAQGSGKHNIAIFRFFIRGQLPQLLDPHNARYEEGELDASQVAKAVIQQFAKQEGTIDFVAGEKDKNGSNAAISVLTAGERLLVVDPKARSVSFALKDSSGRMETLVLPFLDEEDGRHRIIVTWGPKSGRLLVDGVQKEAK
jgi:hypothetical protein